jgi:hypothetical protein
VAITIPNQLSAYLGETCCACQFAFSLVFFLWAGGMLEHCGSFLENLFRRELHHTVEVTKRTHPFETGAAGQIQADDPGLVRHGRSKAGAGRAEQGDHRLVECGGNVHQAGIVDDGEVCSGKQVDGLGEVGLAAQVVE